MVKHGENAESTDDEAILEEALNRFKIADLADNENRILSLEDIRFVHDDDGQWTQSAKDARKGRPCMTFDHTSNALDQVLGDYLQSKPGIKVRGVDDKPDPKLADIYTGLIRNIESSRSASSAYDCAFKLAATGGYGVWRVCTDYTDEMSFDQCVEIRKIANPFTILFDPMAVETTKWDGKYCFAHETLPRKEFEAQYPKAASGVDLDSGVGERLEGWFLENKVRIAEYWRKKPSKKTICKLSSGEVVEKDEIESVIDDLAAKGITILAEREADCHKIEWFKISGKEILDRGEWAGKYLPFVPVFGKTINIEGENKYRGLVRKAKDPQRSYNYHRSQTIEVLALQPKAPFMATPAMLAGFDKQWSSINSSNAPVVLYNVDPVAPGLRPTREPPPAFPSGLLQEGLTALDDIKSATGIYDAGLGDRSNETSGVAINARKLEGDTANYEFQNNFNESLELTGRILVDLIPKIYDTERVVRILGEDGAESYPAINKVITDAATGRPVKINDLNQGRYDVVVSAGASYSTRRVETAAQLAEVMKFNPGLGEILSDLWVKSLDLVGGDDAVKRIRKLMILKGLVEPTEEEQKEMPQQKPDPMQELATKLELAKLRSEIENKDADTDVKSADAAMKEFELAVASGNRQLQAIAIMNLLNGMQGGQNNPQMQPMQQNQIPTGGEITGF